MKPINLVSLLKNHTRGWVAISKDYTKVLYTGKTFPDIMVIVDKDNQRDNVILLPAAKNYRGFVGKR